MKFMFVSALFLSPVFASATEPSSFCVCEAKEHSFVLTRYFHFGSENWEATSLAVFQGPLAQSKCESRLVSEPLCGMQRP